MDNLNTTESKKSLRVSDRMSGIILPDFNFETKPIVKPRNAELLRKSISDSLSDNDIDLEQHTKSSSEEDSEIRPVNKPKSIIGSRQITKPSSKSKTQIPIKATVKTTVKRLTKKRSKNTKHSTDKSDSDSEIDVEDTYRLDSESESEADQKEQTVVFTEDILDMSLGPPVYDGEEPMYLFNRRMEQYMQNTHNKQLHETILEFLNKLLCTKYTSLRSIKKITYDAIPSSKKFTNMMESDRNYIEMFRIKYNHTLSTSKMINNILAKIGYSLSEVDTGKELYYAVKSRSSSTRCSN